MRTRSALVLALASVALVANQAPSDPESGTIDPPTGSLDYVEGLPARNWAFGKLLWQGPEPCDESSCEAAYNASPLFILVQRQAYCCGSPGYTLMIVGRVKGCASVSYYLVGSEHLVHMADLDRLKLVQRHVSGIAAAIQDRCDVGVKTEIPTTALIRLKP